jgi:hypothetical protein
MKQPKVKAKASQGMSKDKKQLVVLGALAAVLVLVLGSQFSGSDDEGVVDDPTATAMVADTGAPVAVDGGSSLDLVPDNAALSAAGSGGLERNPFKSFFSEAAPIDTSVQEIPPPSVILNGTLTSGKTPVAVIDGKTLFEGDLIQGWRVVRIGTREVGLESPNRDRVSISMPLLQVGRPRSP